MSALAIRLRRISPRPQTTAALVTFALMLATSASAQFQDGFRDNRDRNTERSWERQPRGAPEPPRPRERVEDQERLRLQERRLRSMEQDMRRLERCAQFGMC